MDLRAGERALEALEQEASRLRGIGDLRRQLDDALQRLTEQSTQLATAGDALLRSQQQSEQDRQQTLATLLQSVDTLREQFGESRDQIITRLDGQVDAIRTGLAQIHRQVQELAQQIDQGVKAELGRSLGELRVELSTSMGNLTRQLDLAQREHTHAMQWQFAELERSMEDTRQAQRRAVLTSTAVLGGLVIASALALGLILLRS